MKKILSDMGEPAALELLAEECTELAQSALKLARKQRGENPTPVTLQKCVVQILEEMADVWLCINVLKETDWYDQKMIDLVCELKLNRWKNRMGIDYGSAKSD